MRRNDSQTRASPVFQVWALVQVHVAPERLAQFRVSYDTPLRSLVKVLSVAWIDGKRKIIGCAGDKRIVAILHAHCGLLRLRQRRQ